MAQVSDVSLANQGFSAFRTELNNILGALNTAHDGTSAPSLLASSRYAICPECIGSNPPVATTIFKLLLN